MSDQYDVIVVGLGGMGSSAAYHLARRGHRVLGLEQFTPAHARGSSHGGSRIVRQAYFEDPAYVPLLLRSYQLWDELNSSAGQELFKQTGGLYVGLPDCQTVAGSLAAAQLYGLEHELLDAAQLRARFPQLAVEDAEVGVLEVAAGFARPELTVQAQLDLAGAAGAELHFNEPVLSWSESGSAVTVTTSVASYDAAKLVICPGAWAPTVLADLGVPMVVERQVQYWFEPSNDARDFALGRFPIFIWEGEDDLQLYGFPATDGPGGGVKTAFYRRGSQTDPDRLDLPISDEEIYFISQYLRRKVPALAGKYVGGQACMYTNSPDHNFVIGPYQGHGTVSIACGFSGHGFKFVPVVGEILADLAERGSTAHSIDLFDPSRFV